MSCLPVYYNSYYRERTGKRTELSISNSVIDSQGFPTTSKLLQESGELCSLYNSNTGKLADVWCLKLCAGTLFVLLLKFGAVLSIICSFLMVVSCWMHMLQCIVIMRPFLRLLKLCKLVVCKLDLSRRDHTRCHRVLHHGLNYIPLTS